MTAANLTFLCLLVHSGIYEIYDGISRVSNVRGKISDSLVASDAQ